MNGGFVWKMKTFEQGRIISSHSAVGGEGGQERGFTSVGVCQKKKKKKFKGPNT